MTKQMQSLATVVTGSLVVILAVVIAPIVVLFILGQFPAAYLESHADLALSLTYAIGTIAVAIIAGVAVGLLAPARPLLHALVTAAIIVGISVIVAGSRGLPHGWQIAGLLCQVALMVAVAALTWHLRAGRASVAARSV